MFVTGTVSTSRAPSGESEQQQASDVVPRRLQDEVKRRTSDETDSASLLEREMKKRQSKITDNTPCPNKKR